MFLLIMSSFLPLKLRKGIWEVKPNMFRNSLESSPKHVSLLHPEDACRHLNIQFMNPIISIISTVVHLYSQSDC